MNNASMIYWIGVVDNLISFIGTITGLSIAAVIALAVTYAINLDPYWGMSSTEEDKQKFYKRMESIKKWIVVCSVMALVCGIIMVFIPTEKRLWAMWIADRLTYENMQSAVDYIVKVVKELK